MVLAAALKSATSVCIRLCACFESAAGAAAPPSTTPARQTRCTARGTSRTAGSRRSPGAEDAAVVLERLDDKTYSSPDTLAKSPQSRATSSTSASSWPASSAPSTKGVATPAFARGALAQRPRRVARRHDALERGQVRRAERGSDSARTKGGISGRRHTASCTTSRLISESSGAVHEQDVLRIGTRNCITCFVLSDCQQPAAAAAGSAEAPLPSQPVQPSSAHVSSALVRFFPTIEFVAAKRKRLARVLGSC